VDLLGPAIAEQRLHRLSEVPRNAFGYEIETPVGSGGPDVDGDGLREGMEAGLALAQHFGRLFDRPHTRAQRPLRTLPRDGVAGELGGGVGELELGGVGLPRLVVIHGERAEDLSIGAEDGRGPAGSEAVRPREVPELGPEWIAVDIAHHDALPQVGGGSTATGDRADAKAVDGAAVLRRKMRCRPVLEVFTFQEQHRSAHARRDPFDEANERVERSA
jgi:hypothetical protein